VISTLTHIISDYATREEWLAARSTFIGASESAAILNCGYSGTNALTVYASKIKPEESRFEATDAMIIGDLIQPALITVFNHFHGRENGIAAIAEVPNRVRRHGEMPFIAASLDAIAVTEDDVSLPLELKNVDSRLMSEWKDDGECPLKFQVQVAHQMLVTGADRAYLMGLIGGNKPKVRELYRNDKFIGVLQMKLVEFWGFVERREIPTDFFDWSSDATSDALKCLHPDDNGQTVLMPAESSDWFEQLLLAKEKIKEAEEIKTAAENRIKAAIGDSTFGLLPDGQRLSWKTQERAGHVVKPSKFRVLRACK